MYKLLFIVINLCCYSAVFAAPIVLLEEDFENCSMQSFSIVPGAGDMDATKTWECVSASSNNYIEMSGLGDGADEDWLISPSLDLTLYENEKLSFWYKNVLEGQDIVLLYSTDYIGDGATASVAAATWLPISLDLYDISASSSINQFLPHTTVDISFIQSSQVYFAFQYVAANSDGETWQLDDISISADYYSDIELLVDNGVACAELKTAVAQLLREHETISYTSSNFDIWDAFYATDRRLDDGGSNTIVWDMYSDNPTGVEPYVFNFGANQDMGSGGGVEGQFYNREHSFPKSWWGGGSSSTDSQYVDLHHVFPSDKQVNQIKSNFSIGETASPTTVTMNGSELGSNAIGAYTGTVFEPIDEYKGDFARAYFYMGTRYQHLAANWEPNHSNGAAAMNGNTHTFFEDWLVQTLLMWHENDPVSEKELLRNETIFTIQHNRNPYIDHPEYVALIWGAADGSPCMGVVLPLAVLELELIQRKDNVLLNWPNSLAINGDFVVEHSLDGLDFAVIARVHGTTFLHQDVAHKFANSPLHYYRLTWQNAFGEWVWSSVQAIRLNENKDEDIKMYFKNGKIWFLKDGFFWDILGQQ